MSHLNTGIKVALQLLVLCLCTLFTTYTIANEAATKGLAIAQEADKRNTGFGDSQASFEMLLMNRQGQSTKRQLRNRVLEQKNDGDKSITIFDNPGDVKGTVFLSYTHKVEADDQWLYLPALKRVKRISSANKSGPFMGSEFAFEDMSSQEIEKYTYRYIKNETFDGRDHFVIERIPKDKKSGYSRQLMWIDTQAYRTFKIEFYDRKKALLKVLVSSDFKQYLNKFWRPSTMKMMNEQTKKSTVLTFSDYKFNTGLTDKDFSTNALRKAR